MESVTVSETDLQLLHALQISPRVPWNVLGDVLGISSTTAARHWARLSGEGLAWVTAYRPDLAGQLGDPVNALITAVCAGCWTPDGSPYAAMSRGRRRAGRCRRSSPCACPRTGWRRRLVR
jgi:hypothetical protein